MNKKGLRKRRHGGKLRKIVDEDRDKRIEHDKRTSRYKRAYDKKKVIPNDNKSVNVKEG